MDSHRSYYLEAIQAIPGCTPSQKYRELNAIAKRAVSEAKSHGDVTTPQISLNEVPEPLVPLVRLKIAIMLRQTEIVAEALKSEDCEMVNLALRAKWFFQADNKEIMDVRYFKTNLHPSITLDTRKKIIKRLTVSFRRNGSTGLAEEFYNFTRTTYGKSQAEPLFAACSESFVWKTIIEQKIVLSRGILKNLFGKRPELVVRYLKLSKPDDKDATTRNLHRINIDNYTFLLPRLINNHLQSLIELIEMHGSYLDIKLSNKATERFLKGNVDVVLDAPILYRWMMPLKVIAAKITKSQYKRMFAKVFPPNSKDFQYSQVKEYLEHYPEQERISLLLETYSKVYNANMLDNHDIINVEILKMLPIDERVRQARIKLKEKPDWYETNANVEETWRCYFPLEETIAAIKTELSSASSAEKRLKLLQQMFFVCSINDDKEALLEALRYFTTRHRNERIFAIFEVLDSLVDHCDLSAFGKDHWSVMIDFLKFLNVKDELKNQSTLAVRILTASLYFKLTHDLPIDENIELLVEIKMKQWNAEWCMFEKYPEYDRLCFDKMMAIIPCKYPQIEDVCWRYGVAAINRIAQSMGAFNERNTNKSNNTKMEKLSIKNYPWLLTAIEKLLATASCQRKCDAIIKYLKEWEFDLHEKWIRAEFNALADVQSGRALKILKVESSKILDHCEEYWQAIIDTIRSETISRRFVRATRWYQDIPIRFLTRCRKNLSDSNGGASLMVHALLMQGSEFACVIEPLIPKNETSINTDNENAKSKYGLMDVVPRAMNLVNPPVPLALVNSFCDGDFLHLGLICLTSVSRRCTVEKVEKFAKQLSDHRVSVRKHGIRLFCLVATIADCRDFLVSLWRTEEHRSIRAVILKQLYCLFLDNPSPENCMMLKDCMANLKIEDDDILDIIQNFDAVPDAYIAEYMSNLLETFERLVSDGFDSRRMAPRVSRYLHNITAPISRLLTDEFSDELLKKYFCNSEISPDVVEAGMDYALHVYLRADPTKLDSRLQTFAALYTDRLREHWNKPYSEEPVGFPLSRMTQTFVHNHLFAMGIDSIGAKIMKTVLDSFLLVLKPQQDWTTYALLKFGIALGGVKDATPVAENIANTLPHLVENFSSLLVIELADVVKKLIHLVCDNSVYDHLMYEIIETLCRVATSESCTLAAKLLFISNDRQYDTRRNNITRLLLDCPHPAAVSLAYQHIIASASM